MGRKGRKSHESNYTLNGGRRRRGNLPGDEYTGKELNNLKNSKWFFDNPKD